MSITEHLEELRRRIFYTLIFFVIGVIVGFLITPSLYRYLVSHHMTGNFTLHAFSFWDAMNVYLQFSFISGFVLSLPVGLYQIWKFVSPGLAKKEQKVALRYIPIAMLLLLIGFSIGYFIMFPLILKFSIHVTHELDLTPTYGVSEYFSFLFNMVLPVACIFEFPLIVMFLTRLHILHPNHLKKTRKIAYFLLFFVAALITPPDLVIEILMALPLIGLYELSIYLSSWVYQKQEKEKERKLS